EPRHRAGRARARRVEPENHEERDTFERELVQLRRVPRHGAAGACEHHRPRHVRRASPELLINKVADAPGPEADRHERRDEIGDREEAAPGAPPVEPHRRHDAEEAAVERHSAGPEVEDFERVPEVIPEVVEEHVPEAAADDGAEREIEQEVADLRAPPARARFAGAVRAERPAAEEADEVHEAVPVDLERADGESDGNDVGGEHGGIMKQRTGLPEATPVGSRTALRYSADERRASAMSVHRHTNRLIDATSPYLLQHAHNPVDWYPWGEEALERARREDKPILLSIGYSACHWCHVMERESFEDEDVARVMNEHYVCIKVDREERPDLDKVYQTAHQLLAQRPGGWPLTVFLTPDDHLPFFAGTYFPKEPRYG